jgi:hypothetical protein
MRANRGTIAAIFWMIGCSGTSTSNNGTDGGTEIGGALGKVGGAGGKSAAGGGMSNGGMIAAGGMVGGAGGRSLPGGGSALGGQPRGGVVGGTGGRVTGGTDGGFAGDGGGIIAGKTGGAVGGKGGVSGQGGASTADAGTLPGAGNPNGSCSTALPARAQPVDTSNPTSVVGTGTEESCTFSQLKTAAALGGVITFNCGSNQVTILISSTLNLPTNKNTVIDGGNRITLDGGNAVQIISFKGDDFMVNDMGLTLQHITLINGKATPTEKIPTRPAPCSQGWNDGEGGAVYMQDGNLTIIDSIFADHTAAPLGPDTGGGAIYILGSKRGVMIVGSTFTRNSGSNAGAVGCLFAELNVYNSLFTNNTALGNGANYDDDSKCSFINNDQHEVGSGGNGGALYSDGTSKNVTLCGNAILNNKAGQGAFGGGLFFTSNDMGGTLTIRDTTMTGNTGGSWTVVASGSVDDVGTAVGTNAKSITVTNSNLQGMR